MSSRGAWIKEDTEAIKTELWALSLETAIIVAHGWRWHLREEDKGAGLVRRHTYSTHTPVARTATTGHHSSLMLMHSLRLWKAFLLFIRGRWWYISSAPDSAGDVWVWKKILFSLPSLNNCINYENTFNISSAASWVTHLILGFFSMLLWSCK